MKNDLHTCPVIDDLNGTNAFVSTTGKIALRALFWLLKGAQRKLLIFYIAKLTINQTCAIIGKL